MPPQLQSFGTQDSLQAFTREPVKAPSKRRSQKKAKAGKMELPRRSGPEERLAELRSRYGKDVAYLLSEFTKLEAQHKPGVAANGDEDSRQKLARLQLFVEHVRKTLRKLEASGAEAAAMTLQQVRELDEHIRERLIPVKDRLVAQLAANAAVAAAAAAAAAKAAPSAAAAPAPPAPAAALSAPNSSAASLATTEPAEEEEEESLLAAGESADDLLALGGGGGGGGGCCCGDALCSGGCACAGTDEIGLDLEAFGSPAVPAAVEGEAAAAACDAFTTSTIASADAPLVNLQVDVSNLDSSGSGGNVNAFFLEMDEGMTSSTTCCTDDSDELYSLHGDGEVALPPALPKALSTPVQPPVLSRAANSAVTSVTPSVTSSVDVDVSAAAAAASSPAAATAAVAGVAALSPRPLARADSRCSSSDRDADDERDMDEEDCTTSEESDDEGRVTEQPPSSSVAATSSSSAATAAAASTAPVVSPQLDAARYAGTAASGAVVSAPAAAAAPAAVFPSQIASYRVVLPAPVAVAPPKQQQQQLQASLAAVAPIRLPTPALAAAAAVPVITQPALTITLPRAHNIQQQQQLHQQQQQQQQQFAATTSAQITGLKRTHSASSASFLPNLKPPRVRKRQRSLLPALSQPRDVLYECAACKDTYSVQIACNPWWAMFQQECPHCHAKQVPRVDITNPVNNVDSHTAVLSACAEDDGISESDYSSDEDEFGDDGSDCDDTSSTGDDFTASNNSASKQQQQRQARLQPEQAAKLLVMMNHARTCPGHHANPMHEDVCRSTKFLMLHIRDCSGLAADGVNPCPQPWCQPCKTLLMHLLNCPEPEKCKICSPVDLPAPLKRLQALNCRQSASVSGVCAGGGRYATVSSSTVSTTSTVSSSH